MLLRTFRRQGGWGKNPWIEPLASWDSVQLPAKDQNSSVEIGLSSIGQHVGCMMDVLGGQGRKQGRSRARRAVLKHGGYTKEAVLEHKEVMQLIKTSKNTLRSIWES